MNRNPHYGKWNLDDYLPGNPDNQATRPEITGVPSVDKKYQHSLEARLDDVSITVKGEDEAVDVARTNELRLRLAKKKQLRPKIHRRGIAYYREVRMDEQGCLRISYHTIMPAHMRALAAGERLPIPDAAAYLGMEIGDVLQLVHERELRRRGDGILLESINLYKETQREYYAARVKKADDAKECIIASYQKLNEKVKWQLADFYNHFLGLRMLAYGEDWQREFVLQQIQDSIQRHEAPFKTFAYRAHLDESIQESLSKKDGEFTHADLDHVARLNRMLAYANQLANGGRLTQEVTRDIYDMLIPFLYGKQCLEKRERRG